MLRFKRLFETCKDYNLHCCICYQRITDYSVEIYRGYETRYEKVFYSDGHISIDGAIDAGLKYFNNSRPVKLFI